MNQFITFTLSVSLLTLGSNFVKAQGDQCTNAVVVTPGVHIADGPSSGAGYTGNSCDPNSVGGAVNADWYSFTPASNGLVRVYQCAVDTRVHVRTGTCGALNCFTGNDDDSTPSGAGACNNTCCGSSTDFVATGGTEYFIEWDDRWTSSGFTWTLEFHDCEAPEATFTRVNNCANFEYSIDVDLTSLGTSATVDIVNDGGAPSFIAVGTGLYTVGPFASSSIVTLNIVHDSDPFCDLGYGPVVNYPCPIISCGPDNYSYCYGDNDTTVFIFQSATTDPLVIQFNAGGINNFGDSLIIYDGDNVGAPVLFAGNNGGNLGGINAISTNPSGTLLLQAKSNAFTSCQSGGVNPAWNWDVICLDCTPADVQYDLVPDCQQRTYSINVVLTGLGGSNTVDILNNGNAPDILGVGIGTHVVGPFAMNDSIRIDIVHDNFLCSSSSTYLNYYFDSCAVVSCGQDDYNYCYKNNDDSWWLFRSGTTGPIGIFFTAGDMALGDKVTIYNGATENAGVLYTGNNGGDLAGLDVLSNNSEQTLLLRFTGDGNLSCDDGFSPTPASWSVSCTEVGIEESLQGAFRVFPNPSSGALSLAIEYNGVILLSLKDVRGRVLFEKEVISAKGSIMELDLSAQTDGVYFLEVETSEEKGVKKILLQR